MPEAITKYAINSTLGTSNFKPLDVQIAEQFRMVPSDEIYCPFEQFQAVISPETYNNEFILPYQLKMTRKGTARLRGNVSMYELRTTYGSLSILRNNVVINTINFTGEDRVYSFDFSDDVVFNIGDVLTFKLVASNSHDTQSNTVFVDINLCGTLKQDIFDFVE